MAEAEQRYGGTPVRKDIRGREPDTMLNRSRGPEGTKYSSEVYMAREAQLNRWMNQTMLACAKIDDSEPARIAAYMVVNLSSMCGRRLSSGSTRTSTLDRLDSALIDECEQAGSVDECAYIEDPADRPRAGSTPDSRSVPGYSRRRTGVNR